MTTTEAVVAYLRKYGPVSDERGGCTPLIADALSLESKAVSVALAKLEARGVVLRDINRRKKRTYAVALAEINGKGKDDGELSNVRGGDRVGDDGQRKAPAVRRKAKQGRRPQRRTAGGKRPAGRGSVRKGRRRVDAASHDVSAGQGLVAEAELRALAGVTHLFLELTPTERERVIVFMVDAFGVRQR